MVIEQKEKPGAKGFARKHWSGGAGRRKEGRDVSGWWFYESPRLHSMLQPTTSQVYICGMGAEGRRRGKKIENAAWRTRNRGAKNKGFQVWKGGGSKSGVVRKRRDERRRD